MNEIDVLKTIAEKLSSRNNSAALSNYKVLCNNIKFANELFRISVNKLKETQKQIELDLANDTLVQSEARIDTNASYYFRKIIPTILLNDTSVIEKFLFYTQPDDRIGVTIDNLDKVKKGFIDFNNLVTASRQFIDSLVADAYQLTLLDPKETNFQVLTSLSSFYKFATKSIVHALFNTQLEDSLREFESLPFNQKVKGQESNLSKCSHNTFGKKVDFLFATLNITTETDFQERLKNLFSFSSEFTHIGYVSTCFTSSNVSEVIFTDGISPYLSSTENFSELKYEILETAIRFYREIYLPSFLISMKNILEVNIYLQLETMVNQMITNVSNDMATRNNSYFFPIKSGLIGSDKTIDLRCRCNDTRFWKPPHENHELFCENCGSKFTVLELEGEGGYILTGEGPVRIIGSDAPELSELERAELHKKYIEDTQNKDLKSWSAEQFFELEEEKRSVLAALAGFRDPCPIEALILLLPKFPREEIESILKQLESERLINLENKEYQISSAIRDVAYSSIPDI